MIWVPAIFWMVPLGGALGVGLSWWLLRDMLRQPAGGGLQEVAARVDEGVQVYLKGLFRTAAPVFAALTLVLGVLAILGLQSPFLPFAFLAGGITSALCGLLGLVVAGGAPPRAAWALRDSLDAGMTLAYRAGGVLGLAVAGIGLLDISLWYFALNLVYDYDYFGLGLDLARQAGLEGTEFSALWLGESAFLKAKGQAIASTMLTFGLGASAHACIARMGGSVFHQAANLGADILAHRGSGISRDDPRNPAAVAGRVGSNVSQVAGLGSDLFASFTGAILCASALGAAVAATRTEATVFPGGEAGLLLAPMLVAAFGSVLGAVGILSIRIRTDPARTGHLPSPGAWLGITAGLVSAAACLLVVKGDWDWGPVFSIVAGMAAGLNLGKAHRHFTSSRPRQALRVARAAKLGPAAVLLEGLTAGLLSSVLPLLAAATAVLLAFACPWGGRDIPLGLYGIGLAAVGMVSTLAVNLSLGACGPIARNAGSHAELARLDPEIRERAGALRDLGAAPVLQGRGFASGAACLTTLALLAAWAGPARLPGFSPADPNLAAGLAAGVVLALLFGAIILRTAIRAAGRMVDEVKRQFADIGGLLEGEARPDSIACLSLLATASRRGVLPAAAMALAAPALAGALLAGAGVFSLLLAFLAIAFVLAAVLDNAGDAWNGARRFIERGNYGGMGSEVHQACIIGCMVGDPLRHSLGPALVALSRLMATAALVSTVAAGTPPG